MIPETIAAISRQQERMMNTVTMPEGNAILVILEDTLEHGTVLDLLIVVCVASDEQKSRRLWLYALKRTAGEVKIKLATRMWLVHGVRRLTCKVTGAPRRW